MDKDNLIERIAKHLIINASFMSDLGLYHGKMGIVLFFAHYTRYTENTLYQYYFYNLIDEIYEDIHSGVPVGFENGLCGIGWGIEYLVQNQFMTGNTGEILEDIDRKIMEIDPLRMQDISFRKGLAGVYYYVFTHIQSPYVKQSVFDMTYLSVLTEAISKLSWNGNISNPPNLSFIPFLLEKTLNLSANLEITSFPLGIENGLSGYGLKQIGI
jgi:lantibiotic modifying enzyme